MFPRSIFSGRIFAPTIFPQSQGVVVEFEIHAQRGSVRWARSFALVREIRAKPSIRELT